LDALIRAAKLDPARMRLSEFRSARVADHDSTAPESPLELIRGEIESRLRMEMALQAQEQYEIARARGLADGRAAGLAEATEAASDASRRAIEALTEKVRITMSVLEDAHRAALRKLEENVGDVAYAAICCLAGDQAASRQFVLGVVERTCARLRGDMSATVRLHPRDIDILRDLLQEGELRVQSMGVRVVPDESLELGGCLIEADSGHYDGGLESQLRKLHSILTGVGSGAAGKG